MRELEVYNTAVILLLIMQGKYHFCTYVGNIEHTVSLL